MLRIALAMMFLAGAGLTACTAPVTATDERHCTGDAADCGKASDGGGGGGY